MLYHLALTDYIGRRDCDRLQYLVIRALPFLTCLLDLLVNTSNKTDAYRYVALTLMLIQLVHMIFHDWQRAFESPFRDLVFQDESSNAQ